MTIIVFLSKKFSSSAEGSRYLYIKLKIINTLKINSVSLNLKYKIKFQGYLRITMSLQMSRE